SLPVHEQYWIQILRLLARYAPCVLNIRRNDSASVGFTSPSLSPQVLEQFTKTMNTRQLGSTEHLFKFAGQWILNEFSIKAQVYSLDIKPLLPEGVRVSLKPKGKR